MCFQSVSIRFEWLCVDTRDFSQLHIQILLRPQEYRTGDFFSCCCVVLTVASLRQIFFLSPAAELAAQQIVANISPYFYRPILLPSNSSVGYRFGILESFVIEKSLAGKIEHLRTIWYHFGASRYFRTRFSFFLLFSLDRLP